MLLELNRLHRRTRPPGPLSRRRLGAIMVPNVGEVVALNRFLGRVVTGDMTLGLYKSPGTQVESDTLATYVPCTFTGYVTKPLVKTGWGVPATAGGAVSVPGVTSSTFGPSQQWVCGNTDAVNNVVTGATYVDTDSGILLASDKFATSRTLADTDTLTFTPRWEAD